jgi:poly-beta-1,6-N-acetyl-D-glucosamine synthase
MGNSRLFQQFLYWGVWLIIPFLWEIGSGILSAFLVILKYFKKDKVKVDFYPTVSILVPVHNSKATLEGCLKSIYDQDYPKENLEVFIVDNGSNDNGYDIFEKFQIDYPKMKIWWFYSEQGKSKALNKGIFSSTGKYIINIDSDGCLDKNAVRNIVDKFEKNSKISCMTGVVLIDIDLIEKTEKTMLKSMRICELFEYSESFLVGRNFQSMTGTMYTMAGAFSCFRREALMKTQMYNSETLGEDTHMTFQIKEFVGGETIMCENAFFYVDPIDSLDKLYTQRQRWQRAELEVASLFTKQHLGGILDFIVKPSMRKLVSDHTLTFPRMIWFFAMIYLYFINYPLNLLIGANLLLFGAYIFNSFLYLLVSVLYLKNQSKVRRYIVNHWYYCFLLPFYRFIVYWIRIAGTINSLQTDSRWKAKTLSEEINEVNSNIATNIRLNFPIFRILKRWINK